MRYFLHARRTIVFLFCHTCRVLSPAAVANYGHMIIMNRMKVSGTASEGPILKYEEISLEITLRAALNRYLKRKFNLVHASFGFSRQKKLNLKNSI